jgi:hypothetical protein
MTAFVMPFGSHVPQVEAEHIVPFGPTNSKATSVWEMQMAKAYVHAQEVPELFDSCVSHFASVALLKGKRPQLGAATRDSSEAIAGIQKPALYQRKRTFSLQP